ncbi:MAG: YibE/F family protein [Clostridia bacterium]|nr:YibE/F family protein [Clostridia bacterium]
MKNRRCLLEHTLRVLLPVVILMGIITGSCQVKRTQIKASNDVTYVKAKVIEVLEDYSGGKPYGGAQKVSAKITSGEFKGQICELENSNTYQRGAYCVTGTKVIAMVKNIDGTVTGSVYNYDRNMMVYILLGMFSLCIILVGGKKGMAALYALVFTFVCIIFMYIPLLYIGINGIIAALLTSMVILAISIYILNGWSSKTLCAIVGTTSGVIISGGLAMIIGKLSNLSGYNMSDVESMIYIAYNSKLRVSYILYAGILISSLGAVMDVSVSIVAAMTEIHQKAPDLIAKDLFMSGMHVGHDMMGTMSNTLILAYTGSATGTLLTMYAYEMPYLQIMGYSSIIIEIVCGLCGTMGVILTVPIQAFITTVALKTKHFS